MFELKYVVYVVKKYISMIDEMGNDDWYSTARQQLPYFWRELESRGVRSSLIDAAERILLSASL